MSGNEAGRATPILKQSQDAVIAWSADDRLTAWDAAAEQLLGHCSEAAVGTAVARVWSAETFARIGAAADRFARGHDLSWFEGACVHKDGGFVEVAVQLASIRDPEGTFIGVSAVLRDISDRERLLAEEQSRWSAAFYSAPIGMALVAPDGDWIAVNRALCRLLAREESDLLTTNFQSLTHPADLDTDLAQVDKVLEGQIDGYEIEKRYLRPDETVVWALLSVSVVRDADGQPLYFVSQLQDITARKESDDELRRYAEQLSELARHDPLTGLRNYREFHSMLDHELDRGRRYRDEWSIVLFDLDGFTEINRRDRLEGDQVLHQVGTAIARVSRASDLAARIGGDEFALILPSTASEQAQLAAERISSEIARAGVASLSFGVASWPADGETKELLLLHADMRLQAATSRARQRSDVCARRTPESDGDPIDSIRQITSVARQYLSMDVAYLAEIDEVRQTFTTISGDGSSFGFSEGGVLELESSYCRRMLAGRVPHAVPAVANEPELAGLRITTEANIGSYLGVPVTLGNGHSYGTLCAVSHAATPALDENRVEVMQSLAGLIASSIEHDAQHLSARRSNGELAGMDALLSALTARDHYTGEHSQKVVELAVGVARRLGLADPQIHEVQQVGLLHDIGKVGIPDSILQKRGPLGEQEWRLMRQHPAIGARILAGTRTLAHLAPAVHAEHERFDGRGYPDGLRGTAIPLASRITFACDAYHAMTSDRPYRAALVPEHAKAELRAGAGGQFDPQVVDALLDVLGARPTEMPHTDHVDPPRDRRDVLMAETPRQTPLWEPRAVGGSPTAIGETRAVCRRCGAHTRAVVTHGSIGGTCGNCGSDELDLAPSP
jgi:diguanylate cyclase (GGDEF)-like protein/PAS domain S-box-containing protein